ncbi:MAG: hypothetical protein WD773_07655 [Gemmatimonadales bacterium]
MERLQAAIRGVLGVGFEEGMRALVEDRPWYSPSLPVREVFRLWVFENLFSAEDPLWVFQPVRAGERKYLCDNLGIDRSTIIGLSPRKLADLILRAVGLPTSRTAGIASERGSWEVAIELVEASEDERAAVMLRQRAEAFLRRVLHFFCAAGHADSFLAVLRDPGSLRVPRRLDNVLATPNRAESLTELISSLGEEGWADLGFLALALRKLSAQLERNGSQHITGKALLVFQQGEFEAFTELATVLQPYAHDRPSMVGTRKENLLKGAKAAFVAVNAMIERSVVPDEALVFEGGASIIGASFRGILDTGSARTLVADVSPRAGIHVMFIASTSRDYASCMWAPSPWSV